MWRKSGLAAGPCRKNITPKKKYAIVEGPHPPATGDGDLTQPLVYSPSNTLAPFASVAVAPAAVPLALVAAMARMNANRIAAHELFTRGREGHRAQHQGDGGGRELSRKVFISTASRWWEGG